MVVVLVPVLLAAAVVLGLLWYVDSDRRADAVREDVASLAGVEDVVDRDGVPEVRLAPDVSTEQIATVLDEAARYSDARKEADQGSGFVVVRHGRATHDIGPGQDPVAPALLGAVGAWPATDGIGLRLVQGDEGATIYAKATSNPSVSSLSWVVQQAVALDEEVRASVGDLVAENAETGHISRTFGEAVRDLPASQELFTALAGLGELDPEAVVTTPEVGSVLIETEADQVTAVETRVAKALRDYPGVKVEVSAS